MLILVAILAAFFACTFVVSFFSTIWESFMLARFGGVSYVRKSVSRIALLYAFLRKTDRAELNSTNPKTVQYIFLRFWVVGIFMNSQLLSKCKQFETDDPPSVMFIGMLIGCFLSFLMNAFGAYALLKLAYECGLSANLISYILIIAVILGIASIALFTFLLRPIKVEDIVSKCQEKYGERYQELVDFSQSDLFKKLTKNLEQREIHMSFPWRYVESSLYCLSEDELAEINAFGKHHEWC